MSQALIPAAFLAGVATLAISVPALTEAPDAANKGYAPEYFDHAGHEFRHYESACGEDAAASGDALGGLIGETRDGEALTDCDRAQFAMAARIAFDGDDAARWSNPATGYRGAVTAGAPIEGYAHDCRRAETELFSPDGWYRSQSVTVCRDGEGGWTPVN